MAAKWRKSLKNVLKENSRKKAQDTQKLRAKGNSRKKAQESQKGI